MQAQPSIASSFRWLRACAIVIGLAVSSIVLFVVVTDEEGDSGCGGG